MATRFCRRSCHQALAVGGLQRRLSRLQDADHLRGRAEEVQAIVTIPQWSLLHNPGRRIPIPMPSSWP